MNKKILRQMAKIAKEKNVTPEQIVKICRKVRKEVYAEEYGVP